MKSCAMVWRVVGAVWLVGLLAPSCKKEEAQGGPGTRGIRERVEDEKRDVRLPVLGERRLAGVVQDVRASPDGQVLTALVGAERPAVEGTPPMLRLGALWTLPTTSGQPVKVADEVTNMPGGWLFSSDSRWLLVSGAWDPSRQAGDLYLQDAKNLSAQPRPIAAQVTYFVFSADAAKLAFIEQGVLHVGPLPDGPFPQVAGEVSTAEFSPDGSNLFFRRRYTAGGGLFQLHLGVERAQPRRLLDQAAEFAVAPGGAHVVINNRAHAADRTFQLHVADVATGKVRKIADDALRFVISPDGRLVAWRTSSIKGVQADVGQLWLAGVGGGAPRKLGENVKDFEFSRDSRRLAFRENYQELPLGGRVARPGESKKEKLGDLYLLDLPDGAPRLIQKLCPNFLFSPDGRSLAFTARIEAPEVTRRLLLLKPGATKAVALKDWLYEYYFRPVGGELYFRGDCIREGRACDVLMLSPEAPDEASPKKVMERVYSLRFSEDGSRAMVAYAHLIDETFDLAARNMVTGKQVTVDQHVEWPALILGPRGEFIAYVVKEKKRPGLYVAKAP